MHAELLTSFLFRASFRGRLIDKRLAAGMRNDVPHACYMDHRSKYLRMEEIPTFGAYFVMRHRSHVIGIGT